MPKLKDFLVISRAPLLVGSVANPLVGSALGAGSFAIFLSMPVLIYFVLYYLLIIFACNINCLFDVKVDGKYKRYMSEATKSFGLGNLKIVLFVEFLVIIYLFYWLFSNGYYLTAVISIIGFLFGLSYSAEPVRIKKRGFWSPFPVLIGLYTLPVLGGWFLFQNSLPLYFAVFVIGYAMINEGITLVNTVEDHSEDEKEGIKTWSHIFGMNNTLRIAAVFCVVGLGTVISLFINFTGMSLISTGLLFLSTLTILVVIKQVNHVRKAEDLEKSAKIHAKKMPKWFVMVRFPLLFLVLSIIFTLS
jgi:4-hydroxybenzoate polyprenyltransferase